VREGWGVGARKRELAQGREREKWRRGAKERNGAGARKREMAQGAKERNGEGREKRANGDTGAATLNPAIRDIEI